MPKRIISKPATKPATDKPVTVATKPARKLTATKPVAAPAAAKPRAIADRIHAFRPTYDGASSTLRVRNDSGAAASRPFIANLGPNISFTDRIADALADLVAAYGTNIIRCGEHHTKILDRLWSLGHIVPVDTAPPRRGDITFKLTTRGILAAGATMRANGLKPHATAAAIIAAAAAATTVDQPVAKRA